MMKKFLVALVILLAAALAAVVTRPDKEAHMDQIKSVISNAVSDEVQGDSENETVKGLSSVIGSIGSGVAGFVLDSRLTVDNYYVCSVGKVKDLKGEQHTVSVGAFGHVFTFGKENLKKAIKGE